MRMLEIVWRNPDPDYKAKVAWACNPWNCRPVNLFIIRKEDKVYDGSQLSDQKGA